MESPHNNKYKVQIILKSGFNSKLKRSTKAQQGGLLWALFKSEYTLQLPLQHIYHPASHRTHVWGVSDCLCLVFAKIAHILDMMHLEFLKTLSYSQLFAFLISQAAKSQQGLTVSMTAVFSHFLEHNINICIRQQNSYRLYFTSWCSTCFQYKIQSIIPDKSCSTIFRCKRNTLDHTVVTPQNWTLWWQFRFIW